MWRRTDAAALLLPLLAGLSAATVAPPLQAASQLREYQFGVYYDGRRIGEHRFEVARDGEIQQVQSTARFEVRVLFVPVYRYRHTARELWRDGCLTALQSTTDDNGRRFQVESQRRDTSLHLARLAPDRTEHTLEVDCPATFAYWNLPALERGSLINAQSGDAVAAALQADGSETINGVALQRYRLETAELGEIVLWYRDGVWQRLRTDSNGASLTYELEALREDTGPAITAELPPPERRPR
jgi:hypothetical protein